MRILITGTNGYIGKSLHTALKDKHDVTAITRNNFDLTDAVDMFKFFQGRPNFDVVLHCAVAGASNPRSEDWNIMDSNLKIYYNLLQHRNHFTRLIHFGSGAETYLPSTPYGYSKKVIAKSILNQDEFYNLKIFGVFDENELNTRFIKANILRYIKKEPIQIHQDKTMDFFYMQDLIKVVEYYINEQEPPKEFDCVYNRIHRLSFIANIINNLDKHKVDVVISESQEGTPYTSNYRNVELLIEFIGLVGGIENMYNKLKNETN
jgi:nucleoside-diphosphate-sugar epimerase